MVELVPDEKKKSILLPAEEFISVSYLYWDFFYANEIDGFQMKIHSSRIYSHIYNLEHAHLATHI